MNPYAAPTFHEEQPFRRVWWTIPVIVLSGLMAVWVTFLLFNSVDGSIGLDSPIAFPIMVFALFYGLGLLRTVYFMYKSKLITSVKSDGVNISYPPRMPIPMVLYWGEIAEYRPCKYGEVAGDYVRMIGRPRNNRAYTISGAGQGIHFIMRDSRKVFVGSQQLEAFVGAVNQVMLEPSHEK